MAADPPASGGTFEAQAADYLALASVEPLPQQLLLETGPGPADVESQLESESSLIED